MLDFLVIALQPRAIRLENTVKHPLELTLQDGYWSPQVMGDIRGPLMAGGLFLPQALLQILRASGYLAQLPHSTAWRDQITLPLLHCLEGLRQNPGRT